VHSAGALNVVVLTCGMAGIELAAALGGLDEVRSLAVVTTRASQGSRSLWQKLAGIYRYDGPAGLIDSLVKRLLRGRPQTLAEAVAIRCPGARHLHCDDLHSSDSLNLLKELGADLGVVFAAYRLKPSVFTLPRLGCLNLHLGHAPEFRGSSPGFYEMWEGVPTVGITVHRINEGLDSGPIVMQESFPIDLAPWEDPVAYLRRYQSEVLTRNGIRMMLEVVRSAARGTLVERPQLPSQRPARRRATYRLKRELRRRVARRRERKVALIFT
jgi:folate-dependent phosphoribosylglycinamide formyltransferase PurN